MSNDIFKICFLDENGLPLHYFIFIGKTATQHSSREFFSDVEWKYISEKKLETNISICDSMRIHYDDSIQNIKKKIIHYAASIPNFEKFGLEEMYLLGVVEQSFQPLQIFKHLTQQDTKPFTKLMLNQFLANYHGLSGFDDTIYTNPLYVSNDTFSYEDLLELEWFSKNRIKPRKIPLGFRFISKPHDATDSRVVLNQDLFASSPYDILFPSIYKPSKDIRLQSFSEDFLFKHGKLSENTIYVCLSSRVETFFKEGNNNLLDIYFPTGESNVADTISDSFLEEQRLVDMIYDIHDLAVPLDYKEFGIQSFHFIMHPDIPNKLPLETIFKNIHASIQIPLIQYNPGLRREKIFRLYYTSIAQNGNKIPFLKQSVIDKLTEKPGKIANITMFVYLDMQQFIQVSVESNGNIVIQGKLDKALMPDAFNEWIQMVIYPAILQLNSFTQQTGYTVRPFSKITDDFIEIISLNYRCVVDIPKKVEVDKFMGIMSPFFYSELTGDKRYKRVEYFERMNPIEEYISELLRVTQDRKMILAELRKQFPELTYDSAKENMVKYQEKYRNLIVPGRYNIEVLQHTGFPITFEKSSFASEWIIDVQNINLAQYIEFLHLYLDTLFQITQSPDLVPIEIAQKYKGKRILKPEKPAPIVIQELPPAMMIPIFTDEDNRLGEDESQFELEIEYENEEGEEGEEGEEENEEIMEEEGGGRPKKNKDAEKGEGAEGEDSDDDIAKDMDEKGNLKTLDNYFKRRIKQRNLLLSKTGFTKICPANEKRHPIILTEKEKIKIDQEYPKDKPYEHALKYGADQDGKPFYYICPNYWCIQPGKEGPLTQEDVDAKKCGEIIQDPKNIKPGEYTYKWREGFNAPGFVNRKVQKDVVLDPRTGKEICYPCCFQNWHGNAQQELRKKCNPEEYGVDDKRKKKDKPEPEQAIIRARNVLQMNWVPLPFHRQGLLPVPIQLFLNSTSYNVCMDSNNMPKLNCPILLRYGVGIDNQYFLGCLSDIYSYQRNETTVKNNKEMREILCAAIDLDRFVQLHNASLVAIFQRWNDNFLAEPSYEVSIGKYSQTQLYKRLDLQSETHVQFLESTIFAYENFLRYLRDDKVILDHTYLWEAVTQKNPDLFPRGLNLAILEIMNQDITNNVELLCPTAAYTSPLYDPKKETLILVKQGEVYEPVYLYEITSLNPEKSIYQKTFMVDSNKDVGELPIILKMIQTWTLQQCGPVARTFEQNLSAKDIVYILREIGGYTIKAQVLNYQNKIIGFLVEDSDKIVPVFLPTFPSPSINNIPSKWMDDPTIWQSHDKTIAFLKTLYKKSGKRILCNPLFRILEDEKVVGFLSMTNQFIQIMPYIDNREFTDDLKTINESNYILADRDLMVPPKTETVLMIEKPLTEKEKMVRNIRLETQFYSGFRNTIRILLNLYKSRNLKEKIRELFFIENMSYLKKIKKIEQLLRELCKVEGGVFEFQEYSDEVLSKIQEVFTCQTDCDKKTYCLTANTPDSCKMILPKLNLVNDDDNEKIYFARMADELLRFKRIQLFMMYSDSYLYFSSSEYKIYSNEFVIAKSGLSDDYFSGLIPYPLEQYTKISTYETANPSVKPANPTKLWKEEYLKHRS